MSAALRVLLVGHCVPDAYALKSAVRRALGEPEIFAVDSDAELARRLAGANLLLVNRVLDGNFPDDTGIELVGRLAASGVPAMLISNFPEAQSAAVAAGARPGFGKKDMNSERAAALLREAVKPARDDKP